MARTDPTRRQRLLLVSSSARMLARSAARAGIRPVTLDLYADADTRAYAEHAVAIAAGPSGFDPDQLLTVAARVAPGYPLVYGSGLEAAPRLLERLARGRVLYGNPPAVVQRLKTPERFFELLARLHIPFPEIRYRPPPDPQNWLIKSGCSEGGKGVRFCAQNARAGEGEYYQRRLFGPALSALFLADGQNVRIIGFNTLWTASLFGRPFLFSGAVNQAPIARDQRATIRDHALRLVRTLGLVGLNSLDFMVDGPVCRVLEINPRPSATVGLYDADFPAGLLVRHLAACRGRLGGDLPGTIRVRAFRAVIAPWALTLPAAWPWPDWCADRPVPGCRVAAGEPLCTIHAEGSNRRAVEALIGRRELEILRRLGGSRPRTPDADRHGP